MVQIQKDTTFIDQLTTTLSQEGPFSSWDLFRMAYEAEMTTMVTDFHALRSLEYLPHIEFLPHQIDCADQVIEIMNGGAFLVDAVGLGKTIEAGLILKEYMVRGLDKTSHLLLHVALVNQCVHELNEKFFIPTIAYKKNYPWQDYNVVVSSLDTAKTERHREAILNIDYDFVLVDEAHKLKNH